MSKKKEKRVPRPRGRTLEQLAIRIAQTDKTFDALPDGWSGKCIFCGGRVFVSSSGKTNATIEHIVPVSAGGTNDELNVALAHSSCNSEKGVRHDPNYPKDPRSVEVVNNLLQRRQERFRSDI
jgi:5-methylcytosine-specific restriction endonuclease McrA